MFRDAVILIPQIGRNHFAKSRVELDCRLTYNRCGGLTHAKAADVG
jgi:hypothetical protein